MKPPTRALEHFTPGLVVVGFLLFFWIYEGNSDIERIGKREWLDVTPA